MLNIYVPQVQHDEWSVAFFRFYHGHAFGFSGLIKPISYEFVARLERLTCEAGLRLRHLADTLTPQKINALLIKWLKRLPRPLTAQDRGAGYRDRFSTLHGEFSLTQVVDRAMSGRIFFEQVILREPESLAPRSAAADLSAQRAAYDAETLFAPARVHHHRCHPSLREDYRKKTRIKQYHKEGGALWTKTISYYTRDFRIGRTLKNLPELKAIGLSANRRCSRCRQLLTTAVSARAFSRNCNSRAFRTPGPDCPSSAAEALAIDHRLQRAFASLDKEINSIRQQEYLAA
jgi:hypothetical protein